MPTRKAAAVTRAATTARQSTRSSRDPVQPKTRFATKPNTPHATLTQTDASPVASAAAETPARLLRRKPTRPIASAGQDGSSARTAVYAAAIANIHNVIEASHTPRQTSLLVRLNGAIFDPSWEVRDVSLEDIVLAYLGQSSAMNDLTEREPALAHSGRSDAQ
jgi:hypothetical protein